MKKFTNFVEGISIVPKAASNSDAIGELEFLTSTSKLYINNAGTPDAVVQENVAATLTNKILTGNTAVNLVSGTGTLVLNTTGLMIVPEGEDVLAGLSIFQTFTNKTIDGEFNTLTNIGKGSIPADVVYLNDSQTITNKNLSGNTSSGFINGAAIIYFNGTGTIVVPDGTDTLAGISLAQTLTNKSIDGNDNILTNIGKGSIPADVVYTDDPQTLNNKNIDGNSNNLSSIPNSALQNSSITLNGESISLGDSTTITSTTPHSLVFDYGIGFTPSSFNGSTEVTIYIDSSVVATLEGTQTLNNKTINSPTINTPTITNGITCSDIDFTITGGATDRDITVTTEGSGDILLIPGATGRVYLNDIFVTKNNKIISDYPSSFEIAAKVGYDLRLNANTGDVLFESDSVTVASIPVGHTTLRIADGKTLSIAANGQVVSLAGNSSASATYTITLPAAAPTASTALVYNGSSYVWAAAGGWSMNSDLTLTSSDTLAISLTSGQQVWEVKADTTPVIMSTTPFGSSDPSNGVVIRVIGTSNTSTVTFVNNDAANGCLMNGNAELFSGYVIEFQYISSLDRYVETFRNF